MCKVQKAALKDAILTAVEVFEEVKAEKGSICIWSSEDVLRAALSLYINSSRNGYPAAAEELNAKQPEKSVLNFGKHKFKSLETVYVQEKDKSYIQWLMRKAKSAIIREGCKKLLQQDVAKVVVPEPKSVVTH